MTKPNTKVRVEIPIVQSVEQMEGVFGDLAARTIERDDLNLKLEADLNVARILFTEQHGTRLAELNAEIALGEKTLHAWAKRNPDQFAGKQSLETKHGTLKFFKGQPKVECKAKWTWDKVIERIKDCDLAKRFLRVVEEVNKEELLEHRDDVLKTKAGEFTVGDLGVRITQTESFTIIVKREPVVAPVAAEV